MKRIVAGWCLLACTLCVVAAEKAKSEPRLVVSVELAPFDDVTKKITTFGTLINNPIVPTLMLGSGQQMLAQSYGPFRGDAPFFINVYASADQVAALLDGETSDLPFETTLLYPSRDGLAKMSLNHPGSACEADGTLHLLPSPNNPDDRWVKFTADGKYCAFGATAAQALRAVADFERTAGRRVRPAGAAHPLARCVLTEAGIDILMQVEDAVAAQQKKELEELAARNASRKKDRSAHVDMLKPLLPLQDAARARQLKFLRSVSRADLTLDLAENGLTVDVGLVPRAGAAPVLPCAGFALPPQALAGVPGGAPFFCASNSRLASGYADEAEFRASQAVILKCLADISVEARKSRDGKKYAPLMDDLLAVAGDAIRATPFPSASDWFVGALAFDAANHPCLVIHQTQSTTAAQRDEWTRQNARLAAALERQWPGSGLFIQTPTGCVIDWSAVLDVVAADSGLKKSKKKSGDAVAKALATAKKNIATVLGAAKTEVAYTADDAQIDMRIAAPGVKPLAAKTSAEKSLALALPEVAARRPSGAFYFSLYGFLRDVAVPVAMKFADRGDAEQYKAMLSGMAPAADGSAIAGAFWVGADGAGRGLLRITANELRNYGAAFNAFTAASMSASQDDDADDDADDGAKKDDK